MHSPLSFALVEPHHILGHRVPSLDRVDLKVVLLVNNNSLLERLLVVV